MVYSSFNGRRPGQYNQPRADGPQQAAFIPHSTNGLGPRIPGYERRSHLNARYNNYKNQNQNQKDNYGGHQNYPNGNRNSNYRSSPYQSGRQLNQENYRTGNNFGRAPPSGPRSQQGQAQSYLSNHHPGANNGRRDNYQNHQQFDNYRGSNRGHRGGRHRGNYQNKPQQQQRPAPVTSLHRSSDDSDLFEELIESVTPVAPVLGLDGMYYDRDGDIIIEDAPEIDLVAIVTQGTIELAKITQSLLEQVTAFGLK